MRIRVSLVDPSPPPPAHLPRVAIAEPGESVWIGRAPAATLCVPDDDALDDRHVLIVCYARACRLFDVSGRGAVVDGVAVSEALVQDGSVVRVGATVARVDVLPDGPPGDPAAEGDLSGTTDETSARVPAHVAGALRVLRRASAPLYAILDAARGAPGLPRAFAAQELMAAIPDDVEELDYADAAPYLVRLAPESPLLGQLLDASWGRMECTFLTSAQPFAAVRAFLRDLMDASVDDGTPDGRRVLFRFYDPVVLARILSQPGLDATRFFGPVQAWFVESHTDEAQRGPERAVSSGDADELGVPNDDAGDGRDSRPADDEAWMEPPTPEVAGHEAPKVLLEFRAQRRVWSVAADATVGRSPGPPRVAATRRTHDLLATGAPA